MYFHAAYLKLKTQKTKKQKKTITISRLLS